MIDGETVERDGVLAPPTLQSPAFGPRADDHGAPDARLPTIELGLIDNVAVFGGKVLSVGATVRDDGGLDFG